MTIALELASRKSKIIEQALQRIMTGETLEQIAVSHGITKRTLNTWMLALGDEYHDVRQAFIDAKLAQCGEEIEHADDSFPLARARETFKYWQFIAQTRDRSRYGQDKAVTIQIGVGVAMSEALAGEAGTLLEHLRD